MNYPGNSSCPIVVIAVRGGVAMVANKPRGIEVQIHDYDVDGTEDSRLSIDDEGEAFVADIYDEDTDLNYED